jgi:hypothetical protein
LGAAVAAAFKGAINEADKLSKAAQKLGIPIEELSKLKYAADLSGVSFESLSTAVGKLSRNMADAAGNALGPAAEAFRAIGVSVVDAAGQLRPTSAVLADIAERFAGFRDDAGKTALAIQLFGRAGADLIPLLNQGAAGLKDLGDEAEKLGLVIDQRTGTASERFNDALTKIGLAGKGVANQLAERLAPAFADLAERMVEGIKQSQGWSAILEIMVISFKGIAIAATVAGTAVLNVATGLNTLFEAAKRFVTLDWSNFRKAFTEGSAEIDDRTKAMIESVRNLWTEMATNGQWATTVYREKVATPYVEQTKQMGDATALVSQLAAQWNATLREGAALTESLRTPQEDLMARLERISELYRLGAIDAATASRAQVKAAASAAGAYLDAAGSIVDSLGKVFKNNKAVQYAGAIVDTAKAITATLAQYGATPWGLAAAAAAAAAGAVQIATIARTNPNSGGSAPRAPSVSRAAADQPVAAAPQQTIFVEGISPSALFSGDAVRALAERLLQYQRDGGRVVLA